MPRSFDIVFESTATVEQVLAAFGSRDYWLARNAEFDGGEKALDSLAVEPDGGVRVVVTEDLRHGALPGMLTKIYRGDILTLIGRPQDTSITIKALGHPDKQTDVADVAFIGAAITLGALLGAIVYKIGSVPLTLSTSGGALMSGLFFGWLRSVHPTFGRIPSSTVWFMNSVGLNVFIAVVGISSGPGFVSGLKQLGFSLFLWGIVITTIPLILAMYVGKYVFRFHPALILGCCAGARTTTAALGMITDRAKSQIPGLGYTVTYAVGNTLLTIWGMVMVMLLT